MKILWCFALFVAAIAFEIQDNATNLIIHTVNEECINVDTSCPLKTGTNPICHRGDPIKYPGYYIIPVCTFANVSSGASIEAGFTVSNYRVAAVNIKSSKGCAFDFNGGNFHYKCNCSGICSF